MIGKIDDSLLTAIANAIRAKTQETNQMEVSAMPSEINKISRDLDFTEYMEDRMSVLSNDKITTIKSSAFLNYAALIKASCKNVTTIGSSAFFYCSALRQCSFPKCTSVGAYAFTSVKAESMYFPEVEYIGVGAF